MPRASARKAAQPFEMDWRNPDYGYLFNRRVRQLEVLRASIAKDPGYLPSLKNYYRLNPADFINDWGITYDPRNAERGLPTTMPFILFPKQREWIDWVLDRWKSQRSGLCEKSRDMGITWLSVALSCTLCLFHEGVSIGFGSRKTEYVDKIGTFKPILPKGRLFLEGLPREFLGNYVQWRDAPYMRISFPDTGSLIAGEGGDDIGRGDRASIYFFDEAAHHPRQELVEAALSQTTNCRIDLSSVRGMNNMFAQKRWSGKISVFIFDWRDDPRKDQAWYKKQCEELDPVVVAQEIDRDYSASVRGVVIPGDWVKSAIGALDKLGIAPSGKKGLSFDVADEGEDKNAICRAEGVDVLETEEWSGKGSDIFESCEYVFDVCDDHGYSEFRFDEDGMGAGVRGDANKINKTRKSSNQREIRALGYRGSEGVVDPERLVEGTIGRDGESARTNEDYYANHKAQSWGALRRRFQNTHRWVTKGIPCNPDEIISLNPKNPTLMKLVAELSQATWRQNEVGKMVVEKKPKGMKSPNMADTVVMHYAPMPPQPVRFTQEMIGQVAAYGRQRRG